MQWSPKAAIGDIFSKIEPHVADYVIDMYQANFGKVSLQEIEKTFDRNNLKKPAKEHFASVKALKPHIEDLYISLSLLVKQNRLSRLDDKIYQILKLLLVYRNRWAHTGNKLTFSEANLVASLANNLMGLINCAEPKTDLYKILIRLNQELTKDENKNIKYIETLIFKLQSTKGVTEYVGLSADYSELNEQQDVTLGFEAMNIKRDFKFSSDSSSTTRKVQNIAEEIPTLQRVMIVGDRGSGKSTTIRYLVYRAALSYLESNIAPIPILVDLGIWRSDLSLLEYISRFYNIEDQTELSRGFSLGRYIVFLDGLNEIPSSRERKINEIIEWLQFPSGPKYIVMSSRTEDYQSSNLNELGVSTLHLMPLTRNSIRDFAQNHLGDKASEFMEKYYNRASLGMKDLVSNPYFLAALIYLISQADTEDSKRVQYEGVLIHRFIRAVVAQEKTKPNTSQINFDNLTKLLSFIAYESFNKNLGTKINLRNDVKLHGYLYGETLTTVLQHLANLGFVSVQEDILSFRHDILREYFAARHVFLRFRTSKNYEIILWSFYPRPKWLNVFDISVRVEQFSKLYKWQEVIEMFAGISYEEKVVDNYSIFLAIPYKPNMKLLSDQFQVPEEVLETEVINIIHRATDFDLDKTFDILNPPEIGQYLTKTFEVIVFWVLYDHYFNHNVKKRMHELITSSETCYLLKFAIYSIIANNKYRLSYNLDTVSCINHSYENTIIENYNGFAYVEKVLGARHQFISNLRFGLLLGFVALLMPDKPAPFYILIVYIVLISIYMLIRIYYTFKLHNYIVTNSFDNLMTMGHFSIDDLHAKADVYEGYLQEVVKRIIAKSK